MRGNITDAALILGICLILSQCGSSKQQIEIVFPDGKITPAYCAGLKTGEAFKEILK